MATDTKLCGSIASPGGLFVLELRLMALTNEVVKPFFFLRFV